MKMGSKQHKMLQRILKVNPTLTAAQASHRLKLFDEFNAIRKETR